MKNIFKKEKVTENVVTSSPVVKEINSPISEPILNHLRMKTTGALLLTGDWGSGKTYHIKKYIFPLIEKTTDFTPIIVSLYGETEKNNIAQKVLFAYFDSKGKNVNLGTGTIAKNVKNLSEAIPYIKKFVDVEKLILGTGENVFRLIPHDKLLICFDDIERMSDKINVDDFLGIINDLVENKGCKVLLIANEPEIKNGITYKEKTIEKTIHFIPNLSEIFDSVVSEYSDGEFKSYLLKNKDFFIQTLTANTEDAELNKELEKSFSNIRTLKFSLEHFKIAFEILVNKLEISELLSIQLRSLWIFTLSISIEFRKPNNITLTERKKLDNQTSTFSDLDFSNFDFLSQNDVVEQNEVENEWSFSEKFKEAYYNRLSETYIFFEELYTLITSGKQINKTTFIRTLEESYNVKEGKVNPAHQIINSFLHQGYWKYTNEQFTQTLSELLDYCEKGKLEDVVSYLNAGVYLLGFNELIGVDKDEITLKIKTGLDLFIPQVNFNHFAKSQFEMVQSNFTGEHLTSLVEHIKQKIKEVETLKNIEEAKSIQSLFESNLSMFVKEFLPERYDFRTPDKPLFHQIDTASVKNGIKDALPEGIMDLTSLLKIRYLDTSFSEYLTDEMKFINELNEGISEMDLTQKTLSNHLIESQLKPRIIEAKEQLQKYIDKKATNGQD
ncbi:P-loop NTPase fold protein [Flavobacterium sp.]|uniref:P-loop NTPase fold protein n=1 Tax=Flavobacterium sp. TaxID=239 RepID=UPI00404843DF